MIPKGNQRGGGQQLAAHLQNSYDNDRVEVADLRGAVAPDLSGAFSEWHAQAKSTKCKKYLYSLSLNPDQRQGKLTREQYLDFIARTEKKLGLESQPRAVVFHVKQGREHCYVVWSRVDTANMRAVPMPHDHQKLRGVAQEFARDHGLELPDSMKKNKGRERYEAQKKTVELGEKQQEERSGITKADRMKLITEAWNNTRTGDEFIRALAAKDYYLARGDRRGYVVVDLAGEVHSLSRQIKGVKTADLKSRLSALPPENLPGVEKAQDFARQRREVLQAERTPTQEAPTVATNEERRQALRKQQDIRRQALDESRAQLEIRHAREMGQLTIRQAAANAGIIERRQTERAKGFSGLFMRLGVGRMVFGIVDKMKDAEFARQQKAEQQQLQNRHGSEKRDADRAQSALVRVERRESKSLETAIRREAFQKIATPEKERGGDGRALPTGEARPILTPEQEAARLIHMQAFARAQARKAPQPQNKRRDLKATFNRASNSPGKPDAAPKPDEKPGPEAEREKDGSLREPFQEVASPENPPKPPRPDDEATSLAEQFNRAAAKRRQDRDLNDPDRERDKHYRKPAINHGIRR